MKNIVILLIILGACFSLPAAVLWDEAVAIRQGTNIEWFRTGIETSDGGAIYVWSDTKLGERDLWAQKVDASGNTVWGEPLLIDGKPDRQEDPVITRTSDNNYIIAWIDFSDDPDGNVYAQKVNNQGSLLWQMGGKPVCVISGTQIALNIEPDNSGGAFIVWSDSRNPSKDLYGQRLDANGNPVWTANGIPIANGDGDEEQNTMLPDGEGGLMIAYTHSYVGAEDVYAKRFDANGNMVWPQTLVLTNAPGNQGKVRMAPIAPGEFVFTWEDQRNTDPDIYAQKVNIAGQTLWPDPFIVFGDSGTPSFCPQRSPRIVGTSDNAVVVVWEDFRLDDQNPDLFAQKINSAGNLLWGAGGVAFGVGEFAQSGARLDADSNGGCYIVWDDFRNGNSPNDDIYAQHLDANGNALWEANGRPVCTAVNQQNSGLVKVSGDNVFINWMDIRDGSVGIYYQVYNAAGTALLENNGKLVFWGLSGDTPLGNYQIFPRANDLVVIWQDTRFANLGYQIYFQFLDFNGNTLMEENGKPVTLQTGADQVTPNAIVTPDGRIAVVWEDKRGHNPQIYAQLLDASGNRLWGDTGLEITSSTPVRQKDPRITYDEDLDAFYIGWSNYDHVGGTSFIYHVYGQMIQNGQKMWGDDGVKISSIAAEEQNNECILNDMKGPYYIWERYDTSTYTQSVYIKKVNTAGQADTGWPTEGMPVSTYNSWDNEQRTAISALTDEGIFVMWRDKRTDFVSNYYGQLISPSGQRRWDPLGINLADYSREQEQAVIANTDDWGNGIIFACCENIDGYLDIITSRYSLSGSPMWGDLGHFVVQKDSTQANPSLARFSSGGMAIAWTEYLSIEADIYYKYINADGSFVGEAGGNILCDAGKSQYEPLVVTKGNNAYVIWADGRSSGKTEILGIFAQKLSCETVSNSDPTAPTLNSFDLLQNHPNPFNPSTTIRLSIKDNARPFSLSIYNIKGQLVHTLHDGVLEKGMHTFTWDGRDKDGNLMASGVYQYRLSDGRQSQGKRMVLLK